MTNQGIARRIIEFEYRYPKSFSNAEYTDYGVIYYDTGNPNSQIANRAFISKYDADTDFDRIIKEIKAFYLSKNLTPRICSDLTPGQLDKIKDCLMNNGFTIAVENDQIFMIRTSECKIGAPYTLKIKRVEKGEDLSFIHEVTNKYPSWRVLKKAETKLNSPDYHYNIFAGYLDDIPVAMATIEYSDGLGFIDEVETAAKHQGKGYARQLTKFLLEYHGKHHKNDLLYLYYFNPVAGRIYKEAGFTEFDWKFELWSAYLD